MQLKKKQMFDILCISWSLHILSIMNNLGVIGWFCNFELKLLYSFLSYLAH